MRYWTIPGTRWWSIKLEWGWRFTPLDVSWYPGQYFGLRVACGFDIELHWYPATEF